MSTTVLHEVFFGIHRQMAVDFNVQVPLCVGHHLKAHGRDTNNEKSQDMWKRVFCDWLDISYIKCLQSFKGLDNKNYLFEVMDKCKEKVDSAVDF